MRGYCKTCLCCLLPHVDENFQDIFWLTLLLCRIVCLASPTEIRLGIKVHGRWEEIDSVARLPWKGFYQSNPWMCPVKQETWRMAQPLAISQKLDSSYNGWHLLSSYYVLGTSLSTFYDLSPLAFIITISEGTLLLLMRKVKLREVEQVANNW